MNLAYRALRRFLMHWPVPYGKGLACRTLYRLFGPAEIKTPFGLVVYLDPSDPLGRDVLCTGWWEPHVAEVLREVLRPGDVFVDIGANLGYHTLLASTLVGEKGLVFAFEPGAEIRAHLEKHLFLNHIQNVRVLPFGLGEQPGELRLHLGPAANPGLLSRPVKGSLGEVRITIKRGDAALPRDIWPRIRLIKLDIEGGELDALRGLSELLETGQPPYLVVEVTDQFLAERGEGEQELLDLLYGYGYTMRRLAELERWQGLPQYDALFSRAAPVPTTAA